MKNKVIIIGAGAAGLFAAMSAAEHGAEVVVLEKMDSPARKLSITGKGRCNLTTANDVAAALKEFGKNGRFLRGAFSRFYSPQLIELLGTLGIDITVERGQRIFPMSMRAPQVVERLLFRLHELGVSVKTGVRATGIETRESCISGVETDSGFYTAEKVILCTGGASYPATGSTGDGYRLAARLGHSIAETHPALVPVEFEGGTPPSLIHLALRNISLTLLLNGQKLRSEFGEMSFTNYGATGPAVLPLGKYVAVNTDNGELVLSLDLKPALDNETLDSRIQRDIVSNGIATPAQLLRGLMPEQAINYYLKCWDIQHFRRAASITKTERTTLRGILKSTEFKIKGTRPIAEAIVTAGGVSLDEINPKTMESKIINGLYICGELLDLDAGTGGYNLQAAFSTGRTAGAAAAED